MKIAITGASGFIGYKLVLLALAQGHELVLFSRKPGSLSIPEKFISQARFEYADLSLKPPEIESLKAVESVIHLAAQMKGDKHKMYEDTINATKHVLEAIENTSVRHLTLVSSISVLDYKNVSELSNLRNYQKLCMDSTRLGTYAKMKRDQELMVNDWAKQHEVEVNIIRPGLVYDDDNFPDAHAGFVKKGVGLKVKHSGEVPVVHVNTVCEHIIKSTENRIAEQRNLFDSDLPTQKEYLQILKRFNDEKLVLPISWKGFSALSKFVRAMFKLLRIDSRTPDIFIENSTDGRTKPFLFSQKPKHNYG